MWKLQSAILAGFLSSGIAYAELGASPKNLVTSIGGQATVDSVLVMRNGSVYGLRIGDEVFEGDRIFTRANGSLQFSFNGCDLSLAGQQAVNLSNPFSCESPVIRSLLRDPVMAAVTVGAAAVQTTEGVAGSGNAGAGSDSLSIFSVIAGTAALASVTSGPSSP